MKESKNKKMMTRWQFILVSFFIGIISILFANFVLPYIFIYTGPDGLSSLFSVMIHNRILAILMLIFPILIFVFWLIFTAIFLVRKRRYSKIFIFLSVFSLLPFAIVLLWNFMFVTIINQLMIQNYQNNCKATSSSIIYFQQHIDKKISNPQAQEILRDFQDDKSIQKVVSSCKFASENITKIPQFPLYYNGFVEEESRKLPLMINSARAQKTAKDLHSKYSEAVSESDLDEKTLEALKVIEADQNIKNYCSAEDINTFYKVQYTARGYSPDKTPAGKLNRTAVELVRACGGHDDIFILADYQIDSNEFNFSIECSELLENRKCEIYWIGKNGQKYSADEFLKIVKNNSDKIELLQRNSLKN